MRLDSVRELKQELTEPFRLRREGPPDGETHVLSGPARPMRELPRVERSLALGAAPSGRGEYRVAVRVQHRELLGSPRLEEIRRAARGEVDVAYVGRVVKRRGDPTARVRPLRPGISVGHHAITAGTLGAFVRTGADEGVRMLSNNHVLADEGRGAPGDEILQPGAVDGGRRGRDRVAALERFTALDEDAVNRVDAALARLDPAVDFDPTLPGVGRPADVLPPEDADEVLKLGRTTSLTRGRVSAIEVDNVVVEFSIGALRFDGQIEVVGTPEGPFSLGGDSGSLIVDDRGARAVGLLFAGSDQGGPGGHGVTFANPIGAVFRALAIDGFW